MALADFSICGISDVQTHLLYSSFIPRYLHCCLTYLCSLKRGFWDQHQFAKTDHNKLQRSAQGSSLVETSLVSTVISQLFIFFKAQHKKILTFMTFDIYCTCPRKYKHNLCFQVALIILWEVPKKRTMVLRCFSCLLYCYKMI